MVCHQDVGGADADHAQPVEDAGTQGNDGGDLLCICQTLWDPTDKRFMMSAVVEREDCLATPCPMG